MKFYKKLREKKHSNIRLLDFIKNYKIVTNLEKCVDIHVNTLYNI